MDVAYIKESGVNRFNEFLQNTKECLIIASLDRNNYTSITGVQLAINSQFAGHTNLGFIRNGKPGPW